MIQIVLEPGLEVNAKMLHSKETSFALSDATAPSGDQVADFTTTNCMKGTNKGYSQLYYLVFSVLRGQTEMHRSRSRSHVACDSGVSILCDTQYAFS